MNLPQNITSWKDVPTLVLSKIFSYLNLRDRLNASLTCKNWSQIFKSPNIWRRVNVVYFGNTENLGDALDSIPTVSNHQTKQFAIVLGRYVQSLTVRFVSCDRLRSDQRVEQLDYCLRSIQNTFCNLSSKLPLLQTLSLRVESVDDTFIKSLSKCLLKTLRIWSTSKNYEAVHVSADSWIQLCHNLPQLKVEFFGYLPRRLYHFPLICLPEVPLVRAGLLTNDFIFEKVWDINRCINYIWDSFPNTLECFVLWKESVAKPLPLDTMTILTMIDKCTKIRLMGLHIPLEVSVIKDICGKMSARENCRLEVFKGLFGEEEKKMLTEMKKKYQFLHLR